MAGRGAWRLEAVVFWSLAGLAVAMLVLLGGLVVGVVPVGDPGADQETQVAVPKLEAAAPSTTPAPVAATAATTTGTTTATTTATAVAPLVVIRAVGGECWVEAREGSADGRLLFVGLLAQGQVQQLAAKQVWLRLGAGENVVVTAGGRRASVPSGTADMVVTA